MNPNDGTSGRRVWLLAAAAVIVLAVAGVVAWLVIPGGSDSPAAASPEASSTTADPVVTGAAVTKALLDGTELTKLLGQPFKATTDAPISGDFDDMPVPSTLGDCVGVVNVEPQQAYRSAAVQSFARQTWADATPGATAGSSPPAVKAMFVEESVVALPSAADARALFATFAEQWKRCDGQAVSQEPGPPGADSPPPLPGTEMHISGVRVTDTVLAASVVFDADPSAPDTRAVGVQGNCLIGVLIAFTGVPNAAGSGNPETSSSDAVRAMMDKVAKLG